MPLSFQRIAGLSGLAALIFLTGCACGGVDPVTPTRSVALLPPLVQGPAPEGTTISRSGFEGGAFAAVLTVRAQAEEPGPSQVLEEIAPVLRAVGFHGDLAGLAGPHEPLRLQPPDLTSLAVEVCQEATLQESRSSKAVCAALRGEGPPSDAADAAIRNAYGVGFAEWKADLERLSFQYPFTQVVEGVPIEGGGISAFRREGESVSLVHGSLFDRYTVVNARAKPRDLLPGIALTILTRQLGVGQVPVPIGKPELVLLPGGAVPKGKEVVPALRYAWRALVGLPDRSESWMVWVDAERGSLLRVASQSKDDAEPEEVDAVRWRRDPGLCGAAFASSPCIEPVKFKVDPKGDKLVLRLQGVFDQVESGSNPAIEATSFLKGDANDNDGALCAKPDKGAFRQINAYSHLYSLWQIVETAGLVPTFPEKALQVVIDRADPDDTKGNAAYYDSASNSQNALSSLWFADGKGFRHGTCPGLADSRLNGAQDSTVMAHEMSHLFVQRLQERRPDKWCGSNTCSMPDTLGHNILHDFADSFAFSYASTNCFAGWTDKNKGGFNANLACQGTTSEAGKFPREAELPEDRFPDHRFIDRGEYANGQIAAAGLWEVRKGLRSKNLTTGTQEYWVRLLRSLWDFGFLPNTCSFTDLYPETSRTRYNSCDRDVFLYLQDLERRMVAEWVAGGAFSGRTVSKVLSGWAKAGLYLVPFHCLDGDPATTDAGACPSGETAPDAVIEIDDQDADPIEDGVVHPEVDYLRPDGPPRFQVWTGPHYRFDVDGDAILGQPSPCNNHFEVQLAADHLFTSVVWTSNPQTVPLTGNSACTGIVAVDPEEWQRIQAKLSGPRVYYRARTWDVLGGHQRFSTEPGGGAFQIDPPFAVITADGKP